MEYNKENFQNVIKQAINLVQLKGLLSLEDAEKISIASKDLDTKENATLIVNAIILAQQKSPFSLQDAAILYSFISKFIEDQKEKKE